METLESKEIIVQIPLSENHLGQSIGSYAIPSFCECGGRRAVRRWKGKSFDGGQRVLIVDQWENECGHIDTYKFVRATGRLVTDKVLGNQNE